MPGRYIASMLNVDDEYALCYLNCQCSAHDRTPNSYHRQTISHDSNFSIGLDHTMIHTEDSYRSFAPNVNMDSSSGYHGVDLDMLMPYGMHSSNFDCFPPSPYAPTLPTSTTLPPLQSPEQLVGPSLSIVAPSLSSMSPLGDPESYFRQVPLKPKRGRPKSGPSSARPDLGVIEAQPKPKRGRPRKNLSAEIPSQRIPHTDVERKYRDGLNSQIEHLRLNVPTLPRHDPNSSDSPPKPGKMTVLSAAAEYIKSLETQVETLRREVERMSDSIRDGGFRSSSS